jgi:hypothetical protein
MSSYVSGPSLTTGCRLVAVKKHLPGLGSIWHRSSNFYRRGLLERYDYEARGLVSNSLATAISRTQRAATLTLLAPSRSMEVYFEGIDV